MAIARALRQFPSLEPRALVLTSASLLAASGIVMVFSAGAFHHLAADDPFFFLRRHVAWLPIGLLGAVALYQIDYRALRPYYLYVLAFTALLLGIVLVPQIGSKYNEARRWLPLGGGMQFQPSELAKLSVLVFVAGFLASDPERTRRFWKGFVPVCAGIFVIFALVLAEPDFGTSVFIAALGFALLVLGRMRILYMLSSVALFAPLVAAFVIWRWEQIHPRLLGFLRPEDVYQVRHSLIALGAGGWFGQGLGAGSQKLQFLPEAHTDFIFSVLGEELGFAGGLAIISLFVVLLWGGAGIAWRARDLFGFLLASGITIALSFQAAVNIAVVTASAPTKGIPLPFLTFGGSGLCMTLAQVGLLLSIERVNREMARPGAEVRGVAGVVEPGMMPGATP